MNKAEQQPLLRIAAIGASAGGITALQSFFAALHTPPNLTLVIIQHLLPGQPSGLAKLVSGWTAMPVAHVEDGVAPQTNAVYVVSPDDVATLEEGVFRTRPVEGGRRRPGIDSIDAFFESLAADSGAAAIGVILTGTGDDGAAGALRIKQAGGIVLVQDPATAMYDGMPLAVIGCEAADHILPIGALAEELVKVASPGYVRPDSPAVWTQDIGATLDQITARIRAQAGFDLSGYKATPLLWRVQQRMDIRRVRSIRDYDALLADDAAELEALIRGIPIHVTEFFRDAEAWDALEEDVLTQLPREPGRSGPIRVWTPACAAGQEAYSVAMLVSEVMERSGVPADLQLFATDAAPEVLARASRGVFSEAEVKSLSDARKRKFFYAADGNYRVTRTLREKMVFAPQDLVADPPLTGLDLVTCRNLLIYLNPETVKRVLYLLHSALRMGGYLFLGKGEALSPRQPGFEVVSAPWRIYRKTGPISAIKVQFPKRPEQIRNATAVPANAHLAVAEHLSLPSVLIDDQFKILRVYGENDLLRVPAGEPTDNLLDIALPELAADLKQGAKEAFATQQSVTVNGLADRKTGGFTLSMRITPLQTGEYGDAPRLFVSFARSTESHSNGGVEKPAESAGRLVDDERSWSEAMRISHHELEASREELQVLNEELRATNDQLNISNDDLNTANQQLQETIAELQMQSRVLSSGAVMTLFLDEELRVRWFTPAVGELFPLTHADAGRRITDFAPRFHYPPFVPDVRRVMSTGQPSEGVLRTTAGRWYLQRILPFRSGGDGGTSAGVAVTFTDITERKSAEEALAEEFRNTRILQNLSARLVTKENIQTIYEEILTAAIEITQAAAGTVQMLDYRNAELVVLTTRGFSPATEKYFRRVDASSHTSCGAALQSGERAYSDFERDSADPSARKHVDDGILSAQSSPLVSRSGKSIGMVSTHWREPGHRPSEREARYLDLLVRQAADFIEQTLAEDALRDELSIMTRMHELADCLLATSDLSTGLGEVLDAALDVFGSRRGTVQILDPEQDTLRYAASRGFDETMLAEVPPIDRDFHSTCAACIRTGERVVADDIAADPRWSDHASTAAMLGYGAAFSSPMKTRQEELLGVMTIHFDKPYAPSERELRWADLFARTAAPLVERARAGAALRESEEKYRTLFESIDEGFAILETVRNAKGHLVDLVYREVNKAFSRLTGFNPTPGQGTRELMPRMEDEWYAYYDRVASTGVAEQREDYNVDYDRWYRTLAQRMGGDGSSFITVVFEEITGRKRAERQIRESEEKYRMLFESIGEGFYFAEAMFDAAGRCVDIFYHDENPAAIGMTGQSFKGHRLSEMGAYEPYWRDILGKTARSGEPQRMEQYAAPDDIWYEFYCFKPAGAKENHFALIFRDVTSRHRAIDALRESEENYRSLFERMSQGYDECEMIRDADGRAIDYRIIDINPAFGRIIGVDVATARGRTAREIIPGLEDGWVDLMDEIVRSGEPRRIEGEVTSLGKWFDVHIYPKTGDRFVAMFEDITERKRAEAGLRGREKR